ncbi:hypothetical protein [Kitasatospora sp. NBC_00315]|uniref:hypothetical protein n=1 Tax=Kitasatospora sp. NBC_00315 TaxID=2975963 RepID=UPI003248251B
MPSPASSSLPSSGAARIRTAHRRLAAVAGLVLAVGFSLTGCDPTDQSPAGPAKPVASSAAAPLPAAPVASTSAPAAPVTAEPSPAASSASPTPPPPAPVAPAANAPATKAPAPTKPPAPKTSTKPAAAPSSAPAAAPAGHCEIVSNAGNCYKAGQFCRDADLGRSTHDADGRMLSCRMVSGKPHWQA